MHEKLEPFLIEIYKSLGAIGVEKIEKLQSLWSGYGGIYRLRLMGGDFESVIVKLISLESSEDHPRGWATSKSHQRKLESYRVEQNWYTKYVANEHSDFKMAKLLYAEKVGNTQLLVLEDLSLDYPVLKSSCTYNEAKAVLKWLASFHAAYLLEEPNGLWPVGTYWHLATRSDEFAIMEDSTLKINASKIDVALNSAKFKTIVHGDAKVANFCFSKNEESVAAVDFQYVGAGVGVKDVAYFLGSCLSSADLRLYESSLLDFYFQKLSVKLDSETIKSVEKEWRMLYPLAWADFNRFLLGWMPNHQKLHQHALSKNQEALKLLSVK